jgi:cell division inhibitor SulA
LSTSPSNATSSVERLESAGLVSVVIYNDDQDGYARTLLWPDEADALAAELRSAAEDIRNV